MSLSQAFGAVTMVCKVRAKRCAVVKYTLNLLGTGCTFFPPRNKTVGNLSSMIDAFPIWAGQ